MVWISPRHSLEEFSVLHDSISPHIWSPLDDSGVSFIGKDVVLQTIIAQHPRQPLSRINPSQYLSRDIDALHMLVVCPVQSKS